MAWRFYFSDMMQNNIRDAALPSMADISEELPSHGPSVPSASQSRRAKNAASRANDVGQCDNSFFLTPDLMLGQNSPTKSVAVF